MLANVMVSNPKNLRSGFEFRLREEDAYLPKHQLAELYGRIGRKQKTLKDSMMRVLRFILAHLYGVALKSTVFLDPKNLPRSYGMLHAMDIFHHEIATKGERLSSLEKSTMAQQRCAVGKTVLYIGKLKLYEIGSCQRLCKANVADASAKRSQKIFGDRHRQNQTKVRDLLFIWLF